MRPSLAEDDLIISISIRHLTAPRITVLLIGISPVSIHELTQLGPHSGSEAGIDSHSPSDTNTVLFPPLIVLLTSFASTGGGLAAFPALDWIEVKDFASPDTLVDDPEFEVL